MPETALEMTQRRAALKHHFDDLDQQHEADTLGMWTFLMTELLLFGGAFLAYAVCRSLHPEAWAEGGDHQYLWLGTLNTAVLLVSSLTMALAVHAAKEEAYKTASWFLLATIALGLTFLGIKFYEYYAHYQEHLFPGTRFELDSPNAPEVSLYFVFYYIMTGLHATHMIIGIGIVSVIAWQARRGRLTHHMPVEITGLYWHLVDIIWVFLFPLLYLV